MLIIQLLPELSYYSLCYIGYLQMEHKIENNWNIFYESQTSYSVGKGRYVIEEAKSRPFPLSTEFVTDVCQLPSHDFSSEKYKAFLDKWGTVSRPIQKEHNNNLL